MAGAKPVIHMYLDTLVRPLLLSAVVVGSLLCVGSQLSPSKSKPKRAKQIIITTIMEEEPQS